MSSDAGFTVWLTGLPCSGKSSVAERLGDALRNARRRVEVLDGDVIRQNLSCGLSFNRDDRDRNVSLIAFVANLLARNGVIVIVIVIVAAVSPYRAARDAARAILKRFVEVHVDCPISECETRDVKGMYKRARAGGLPGFTGIDDPYEASMKPDISLYTDRETLDESVVRILAVLSALRYLSESPLESSSAHV